MENGLHTKVRSFRDLQPFEVITLTVDGGMHGLPEVNAVTEAVIAYIDPDYSWLITCAGRLLNWRDIGIIRQQPRNSETGSVRLLPDQWIGYRARELKRILGLPFEDGRPDDVEVIEQ